LHPSENFQNGILARSVTKIPLDTTQKITEALLDASKKVGLEVNPEKTKYMLTSYYKNAGRRNA
jgi:hypothetical protein